MAKDNPFGGLGLGELGGERRWMQFSDSDRKLGGLISILLGGNDSGQGTDLAFGQTAAPEGGQGFQSSFGNGGVGIKPTVNVGGMGIKPKTDTFSLPQLGQAPAIPGVYQMPQQQYGLKQAPAPGQDLDGDGQIDNFWKQ